MQVSSGIFKQLSIYELDFKNDSDDLLIYCELLEYLEFPELALKKLATCTEKYIILSVPNEPIWRLANMYRLKYIFNFCNGLAH